MIRTRSQIVPTLGLALLLAAAGQARAQCSLQSLYGQDRQAGDFEGASSALSGPFALVGADTQPNSGVYESGKVYCFHNSNGTWTQHSTLTPTDPVALGLFGCSVSLADPYAIVGAEQAGPTGAAYIFQRSGSTWQQMIKLVPPGSAAGDYIGASVAINETGTVAVAGTPLHTVTDAGVTTVDSGIAYVYARTGATWTLQASLFDNIFVRAANDHFGTAVAASGEVVVVGARFASIAGPSQSGYAEAFRRNGANQWVSEGIITASDAAPGDQLGTAVAISGDIAAVGAPGANIGAIADAGAVYVRRYVNGAWQFDGKLTPSDPTVGAGFGGALSVSGNRIAVSAAGAGHAYIFRRLGDQQWVQDARLSDPHGPGYFCGSIALDGPTILTGDYSDDAGGMTDGGAAFIGQIGAISPSDSAAGATPIADGMYVGCNSYASTDGASSCSAQAPDGADVWYQFNAAKTGTATLSTFGSTLDTTLSVHSAVPGTPANTLACNDDYAPPARYSRVTLPVVKAQTYLVRIAGYNSTTGNFSLLLSETCGADYDGNGLIQPADVAAYVNAWFTSLQNGTLAADFDGNGLIQPADVAAFINAWFAALNGAC